MESLRSSYYDNVTTVHPLALALLAFCALAIFLVQRRDMMFPILLLSCLIPSAQRIVIFGLDFHFLRLAIIVSFLRLMARGEMRALTWTRVDQLFVAWAIAATIIPVLRTGSVGVLILKLGALFDALGMFFLARQVIRNIGDLDRFVRALIVISVPISLLLIYEYFAEVNPFYIFDSSRTIAIREGRVRARGAFSHSILAGCYFTGSIPLILALLFRGTSSKVMAVIGLVTCFLAIQACSSSTPILGLMIAVIAMAFYPLRESMRAVRWTGVGLIMAIQIAMAKPIYHLYHRAGVLGVSGSTGYHRYRLTDAFVRHVFEWGPIGVNSTAHWGPGLFDVTNHFILQGVHAGILGFGLFVAVFGYAFRQIGQAVRVLRQHRSAQIMMWGLGASLVAHAAMMTATSYFGQIIFVMFASLGAVASLTPSPEALAAAKRRREPIVIGSAVQRRLHAT